MKSKGTRKIFASRLISSEVNLGSGGPKFFGSNFRSYKKCQDFQGDAVAFGKAKNNSGDSCGCDVCRGFGG